MEKGKIKKVVQITPGIEWIMEDFFSLLKEDRCYQSPFFILFGKSWYLEMNTNSFKWGKTEYITVWITRHTSGPPTSLECSLSLKTQHGEKYGTRCVTRIFEDSRNAVLIPILPISELQQRKSELVPNEVLTVVCCLKLLEPTEGADDNATGECSYCKETCDVERISSHQKKCLDKPIKCPECSDVVLLRNWYEHKCECDIGSAEVGNNNKSESTVLPEKNKILQALKQLYLSREDCDVIIRVKEREFPAHKLILKVRSPVFASTFRSDMKEKATAILSITDLEPSTFSDFLCFLYCEEVDKFSEQNVFDLFVTADKYDVPDLRMKCIEFMKENLSVDTFCDTITLALRHYETELINLATDFFINNATKIIKTVKWQIFVAENPTQSNELFIKFTTSLKDSDK